MAAAPPAPARAVRADFDYNRADEVAALIIPRSLVPQQYHNTDDVGELRLGADEGTSEGSDDEASGNDDEEGEGVEENVEGSGAKDKQTYDSKRRIKRARGDHLGKDVRVKVKVISAVHPKQFTEAAKGIKHTNHTAMAVFTHDESTQEQLVYFEETDFRPFLLAAQRRHSPPGKPLPTTLLPRSHYPQAKAALDRRLKAFLDQTDVDEFDIQMYALFLKYCIGDYRKSFVYDADAVALLAATSAAVEVKGTPSALTRTLPSRCFKVARGRWASSSPLSQT